MKNACIYCAKFRRYADPKVAPKTHGYCGEHKRGVHMNGLCDLFLSDPYKVNVARMTRAWNPAKCVACGYTEYSHALKGMQDKVCAFYEAPQPDTQPELFALSDIERGTITNMEPS